MGKSILQPEGRSCAIRSVRRRNSNGGWAGAVRKASRHGLVVARMASATLPGPDTGMKRARVNELNEDPAVAIDCPLPERLLLKTETAVVGRDQGFLPSLLILHTGAIMRRYADTTLVAIAIALAW